MNKRLADWASIAEVISGVAVVLTLIFLIAGIRENTDITRASVYSSLIDSVNELERDFIRDPMLFELWRAHANERIDVLRQLDERESDRLSSMLIALFRIYEKAYYSRDRNLIDDAE